MSRSRACRRHPRKSPRSGAKASRWCATASRARRHRSEPRDAMKHDKNQNQLATRTAPVRALLFWAVAALLLNSAPSPAVAAESDTPPPAPLAAGSVKTRFLSLGTGKSMIVDLPREAKDVLVANPKVANAVIRSAQRAYIIGGDVGQ